jgi:nitrous oxidase accessory protein
MKWIALGLCAVFVSGYAATLQVQPGQSIQAAIDAAQPGDVLEIAPGLYDENLKVAKSLTLRGMGQPGMGRPTISGGQHGDTIRVTAPDVHIEGLIVRDSGDSLLDQNAGIYIQPGADRAVVRQCDLTYNLFGLWIEKSNDVRIENNTITGKRDYLSPKRGNGIELYNTQGARIIGNDISFVRDALYIDVSHHAVFQNNRLHNSRYGTHYMNSYHNVWEGNDSYLNRGGLALMEVRDQIIRNNRTWGNSDHGIMLRTLQDSVVENNIVADNAQGFFIYDVEYTQVRGNLVVGNLVGVHWAGSDHDAVQGNDFIDNHEQVRYVGAHDQIWGGRNADEKQLGNYWSNYLGWDANGDGVGDTPYEANDVVDRLSWKYPSVQLLLASPAVQALHIVGQQFPGLRVPSVVDLYPRMRPFHKDWRLWQAKAPMVIPEN